MKKREGGEEEGESKRGIENQKRNNGNLEGGAKLFSCKREVYMYKNRFRGHWSCRKHSWSIQRYASVAQKRRTLKSWIVSFCTDGTVKVIEVEVLIRVISN